MRELSRVLLFGNEPRFDLLRFFLTGHASDDCICHHGQQQVYYGVDIEFTFGEGRRSVAHSQGSIAEMKPLQNEFLCLGSLVNEDHIGSDVVRT